jgi:hypothetical protein
LQFHSTIPEPHEHTALDSTALFEMFHKEHASVQQLWENLHKPRQLGLENLPIPEKWERIFYGP